MPLRTLFQLCQLILTIITYSVMGIAFWVFDPQRTFRLFYKHGFRFAQTALRIAGITLCVEGLEHLARDENYVFVANHASLFDIPAIWVAVGEVTRIRIIYKRELQHIPLFGWVLRCSPFIPIERRNPRDSMASITKAIEAVRRGSSAIVFAEGTRSRNGKVGEFKRGAFMLASRSRKPLVPVTIIGSHSIMRPGSFRLYPGTIRVVVGTPIPPPEIADNGIIKAAEKQLMEQLHDAIEAELPAELTRRRPIS